jgi:hypothetical protein
MWKKHINEVNHTEKFGELTEEKIDSILTIFSNLDIEDKFDILLYMLDNINIDFQLVRKHALANDDIKYHLSLCKSGNNFYNVVTSPKFHFDSKKRKQAANEITLEEIKSQTIDKKIELCKHYILQGKLCLSYAENSQKINNFFTSDQEIVKITNAIIDCVKKNNSFNCDDQIINKIKAIERQERLDEFLINENRERLQELIVYNSNI